MARMDASCTVSVTPITLVAVLFAMTEAPNFEGLVINHKDSRELRCDEPLSAERDDFSAGVTMRKSN
jgi:hypothetical protein